MKKLVIILMIAIGILHISNDYAIVFIDNTLQQNEIVENFVSEEVCLSMNIELQNDHKNLSYKPVSLTTNSISKSFIWKPPVKS